MPTLTFQLRVELEEEEPFTVVADQRDLIRWERHPQGGKVSGSHTCQRFLAWSAAQRTGVTQLKWEAFDRVCIEAVEDEKPEGGIPADDAADPGQPTPSASPTSRLRSPRGNR